MEIIKPGTNIDFVGKRKIAYSISGALILLSIISLIVHGGPKFGIDFVGGSLIQVKFSQQTPIDKIKDGLRAIDIENATVQNMGAATDNEFLIRIDATDINSQEFTPQLKKALASAVGAEADIRRVEMVGPQVGRDLQEKALLAIFFSLIFLAIYISGRFEFKWAQSGIVALVLGGAVYGLYTFGISMALIIVVALAVTLALFWALGLEIRAGCRPGPDPRCHHHGGGLVADGQGDHPDRGGGSSDHHRLFSERHHHRLRPDSWENLRKNFRNAVR